MTVGSRPRPENHVIVLFGATGDLSKRKLLPGLFNLHCAGLMPEDYRVIGVSRPASALTDEEFRQRAHDAVEERGMRKASGEEWDEFVARLSFAAAYADDPTELVRAVERGGAGDRRRAAPRLPPGHPAVGVSRDRGDARRDRPRRAGAHHRREAVRLGSPLRERAQRGRARRVRRGGRLSHRPLPRQGVGREHPRPALRERPLRADLEQRSRRPHPDRRARDDHASPAAPASTSRPAPSATWSSPTSSRCSGSSRWSRPRR